MNSAKAVYINLKNVEETFNSVSEYKNARNSKNGINASLFNFICLLLTANWNINADISTVSVNIRGRKTEISNKLRVNA